MPNAKDVAVTTEWLKVCSVGIPGSGKSVFGTTFPMPGFVFDFGTQILTYRSLDFDYEQYTQDNKGWLKFERDLIKVKSGKMFEENRGEKGQYTTVICDDLTGMGMIAMEQALALDPKRSQTSGPLWNVHYQMQRNLMEGKLKQIYDLSANVLLIMHSNIIQDTETGAIVKIEPLLVGQLSTLIPGMFDEVYYHITKRESGETKWYIQTIPIGFNNGRSRLSGKQRILPDLLPNDFQEIMVYATGKKKKPAKVAVVNTIKGKEVK
jgi:hypothetical protein